MELNVDTEVLASGDLVITLIGSLDLASRGELIAAATDVLKSAAGHKLSLDLAGLTFIDSTGIGAIVETAGMAADNGCAFALRDPSARVLRVLQLTGLAELWPVESVTGDS